MVRENKGMLFWFCLICPGVFGDFEPFGLELDSFSPIASFD